MSDIWHVIPVNDLRAHSSRADCWCKPVLDDETDAVWLHNAMDGREAFETGERLAS